MGALRRALLLAVWVVVCLGWAGALRIAQYVHVPREPVEVQVEIPRGTTTVGVIQTLEAAGLAPWREGAFWGLRFWGRPEAVKAGVYAFSGPTRLVDVFADLAAGRVELVRVTLPEGLTAKEMGAIFESSGVTDGSAFVDLAYNPQAPARWGLEGPSLEGFLFPDTYRFARNLPPEQVVEAMLERFRNVTGPLLRDVEARGLGVLEWVTLASVVEKETGDPAEKPHVAAVFLNRLERGMRLESDPTVIYGIQDFDGNLRKQDLRRDTAYNTYTRKGLPPGAIANPGKASLEAILRPSPVPYLYFVSRNDGTHVFSATFEEHRKAVARYQKRRTR